MIAYLLAIGLSFVSSVVIFLPSEVMLLMLSNIGHMPPIHKFGMVIDLSPYATSFIWLLPVAMCFGSNFGSAMYFHVGKGTTRVSGKLKKKLESFDFEKFGKARDAIVFVSGIISMPPVSATAIASGMTKMNFTRYYIICFAGKLVRFYLVLILGQVALDFLLKRIGIA